MKKALGIEMQSRRQKLSELIPVIVPEGTHEQAQADLGERERAGFERRRGQRFTQSSPNLRPLKQPKLAVARRGFFVARRATGHGTAPKNRGTAWHKTYSTLFSRDFYAWHTVPRKYKNPGR